MSESESIHLSGRDYRDIGQMASRSFNDGALGISPGMTDKPNEDSVAAHQSDDHLVLIVTDGHWGDDAAVLAMERSLAFAETSEKIDDDGLEDLLRAMIVATNTALFDAAMAAPGNPARPYEAVMSTAESTLLYCRVNRSTGRLCWASFGDSYLCIAGPNGMRRLNELRRCWLGPRIEGEVPYHTEFGQLLLDPGESMLIASDGLLEPAGSDQPLEPSFIADIVTSDLDQEAKVRALVSAALAKGGLDNVACALYTQA